MPNTKPNNVPERPACQIDQLLSHLHHSQQPDYPPVFGKRSNRAFRVLDSRRSNGRRSSLDCSSTSITCHVVSVVACTQPCACSSAISKCNRGMTQQVKCLINASDLSDARFRGNAKLGRLFRARLINPFEGGRWGVAADAIGLVPMGFLSCAKEAIQRMVILSRLASDETA